MPIFIYEAFDSEGILHKGKKDAGSEFEVRQYLRNNELFPKEIRASRFSRVKSSSEEKTRKLKLLNFNFRKTTSVKVLTQFTRQLEVLLDATIPFLVNNHLRPAKSFW